MRGKTLITLAFTLLMLSAGAGASHAEPAGRGPTVENIDSLLSIFYLEDDQESRSDRISDDSLSSIYLHQIRGGVESHKHIHHHETVWIIRGSGRLTLNGEKHKVGAGTVISIPPGTSHSFYSLGKMPAVLISVFSPTFDGKDRVYDNPPGH